MFCFIWSHFDERSKRIHLIDKLCKDSSLSQHLHYPCVFLHQWTRHKQVVQQGWTGYIARRGHPHSGCKNSLYFLSSSSHIYLKGLFPTAWSQTCPVVSFSTTASSSWWSACCPCRTAAQRPASSWATGRSSTPSPANKRCPRLSETRGAWPIASRKVGTHKTLLNQIRFVHLV